MPPFLARRAAPRRWGRPALAPCLSATALVLSLTACSGPARSPADERRVFRYNQPEALTSLDPAFARNQANSWATAQLYNGLLELDSALQPAPALARRFAIAPNGLTYTFVLRPGVRFHDSEVFVGGRGRAVTAADFVYSFRRLLDGPTASPGGWIFRGKVLEDKAGSVSDTAFVAANDSTLRIHLKEPFIPFLGILTMPYAYVVPHEAVAKYGKDFREHPVGTGPFQFKLWDEGNVLLYSRNQGYWRTDQRGRKLPYLEAVAISFITDRKTEFLTFVQGKLDFLSGIREGSRDLVLNPDGTVRADFRGRFTVQKAPYLNTEYLGFQLDSTNLTGEQAQQARALRDRRVRQALSHALNKPELTAYVLNHVGQPGSAGFVPMALPSFSAENVLGLAYDPGRARALLRDAGYNSARPLRLRLSTVAERKAVAEYMQKRWADVGVQVQIDINQSATQQELVNNGRAAFFAGSWLGDYPDAENYLSLFYTPNFSPGGPNKTHYHNPAYNHLYHEARREVNTDRRTKLYQAMDRLIVADSPVIPVFYDEVIRLTQNNVRGLTANPMNQLLLERVRKE